MMPAELDLHRAPVAHTERPSGHPRVLHVGKYYPPAPGGMERVVQLLCEHERPEVDSAVLVSNTAPRTLSETWRGVPVRRAARFGAIGSVGVCPTLPLELVRMPRDVTVIHEPNPVALVADLAARQRGPLIVWYHSEVLRPAWKYRLMYRPFLNRVLERAARVIVSSPTLAEHAEELAAHRGKCSVIPFGIATERFAPTPAITARAEALRRAHGRPIVLFTGRLVPYKGVAVLLEAMRSVDAVAVIVGDGPLRRALTSQASDPGLAGKIVFAGEVPDAELLALYHACEVFVLPSVTRAEAFGIVQLEAMACARPVISTDLPSGVPWVNRHGESGLVVPPGDAVSLSAALKLLLDDETLRGRLGAGALARVTVEFTARRMAERTTALYREVLAERAA